MLAEILRGRKGFLLLWCPRGWGGGLKFGARSEVLLGRILPKGSEIWINLSLRALGLEKFGLWLTGLRQLVR